MIILSYGTSDDIPLVMHINMITTDTIPYDYCRYHDFTRHDYLKRPLLPPKRMYRHLTHRYHTRPYMHSNLTWSPPHTTTQVKPLPYTTIYHPTRPPPPLHLIRPYMHHHHIRPRPCTTTHAPPLPHMRPRPYTATHAPPLPHDHNRRATQTTTHSQASQPAC